MSARAPLRVLIVEDEVLLAVELEHVIHEAGLGVVGHAMEAQEAIDLAAAHRPELALVDVHLQDGPTGVQAARTLSSDCGAVVLFMTANKQRLPEDYAGACGVIAKPYSEHVVRRALEFVVECLGPGCAGRTIPPGLDLAPEWSKRWGVVAG
jgi:two-component system, response regulator PdtaR